jgi:hypothetical protein
LNVATDAAYRDQMYNRAGEGTTFPQIFIGTTASRSGFFLRDRASMLDRAGKPDAMLAGEKALFMSADQTFTAADGAMCTGLLPEPSLPRARQQTDPLRGGRPGR